jgi:hypothetical protein
MSQVQQIAESTISKGIGVPTAMWGASIQPARVDAMLMSVFRGTTSEWRSIMEQVAKFTLGWVYWADNYLHMWMEGYDLQKTHEDNLSDHEFGVQFVAVLDTEVSLSALQTARQSICLVMLKLVRLATQMLNMLEDRGLVEFETAQKLRAQYLGIDPALLAKRQVEVATQRPLGDIVEEERDIQRRMAQQSIAQSQLQLDMAQREFQNGPEKKAS